MPQQPKSGPHKFLRRYTHLPSLLYLLREKKLTLLSPSTWDDTNDSYCIEQYRIKRKLEAVLALCLTEAPETYHHWRVFAGSPAGVCIRFRQGILFRALKKIDGLNIGLVQYQKISAARTESLLVDELPFVKRAAFSDESEVRVIYATSEPFQSSLDIPIPLDSINGITLSPWLPKALVAATKETIQSIEGCAHIKVVRTTLVGNDEWKMLARRAVLFKSEPKSR